MYNRWNIATRRLAYMETVDFIFVENSLFLEIAVQICFEKKGADFFKKVVKED